MSRTYCLIVLVAVMLVLALPVQAEYTARVLGMGNTATGRRQRLGRMVQQPRAAAGPRHGRPAGPVAEPGVGRR
jgi:hypothetical protein